MSNKHTTLSPTLLKVLEITKIGVAVTPTEINDHVGKGNYASKFVLYLKILGYDFTVTKDGRTVTSYTLTKLAPNHEALVAAATSKGQPKVKAPKAPKAPKAKVSKMAKQVADDFYAGQKKVAAKKKAPAKGGNAANLAKLREIGFKFRKPADEVEATFGNTGEVVGSVDGGWDSTVSTFPS